MKLQMSNNLDLPPLETKPTSEPRLAAQLDAMQIEFVFELPKGFVDRDGVIHRQGVMRLARAMDEIVPMRDPRVKSNPAYATVMILARVITRLGALAEITPSIVESLFACDLNYLQNFYRQINELDIDISAAPVENSR